MRTIKPATVEDIARVDAGTALLKQARDLFKAAGSDSTADKVRAAIISAEGAQRHVGHRYRRSQAAEATRTT